MRAVKGRCPRPLDDRVSKKESRYGGINRRVCKQNKRRNRTGTPASSGTETKLISGLLFAPTLSVVPVKEGLTPYRSRVLRADYRSRRSRGFPALPAFQDELGRPGGRAAMLR
jgi:hypothetical protein